MPSVRELIDGYRNKIFDSKDLQLPDASQYLVELSSLMGNVMEELHFRQGEYQRKLVELLGVEKTSVAKAVVLSKATAEFEKLEEVKGLRETLLEMIRALKYRCRAMSDEMEVSRNM